MATKFCLLNGYQYFISQVITIFSLSIGTDISFLKWQKKNQSLKGHQDSAAKMATKFFVSSGTEIESLNFLKPSHKASNAIAQSCKA